MSVVTINQTVSHFVIHQITVILKLLLYYSLTVHYFLIVLFFKYLEIYSERMFAVCCNCCIFIFISFLKIIENNVSIYIIHDILKTVVEYLQLILLFRLSACLK